MKLRESSLTALVPMCPDNLLSYSNWYLSLEVPLLRPVPEVGGAHHGEAGPGAAGLLRVPQPLAVERPARPPVLEHPHPRRHVRRGQLTRLVLQTINRRSCTITEKAPTRAFS